MQNRNSHVTPRSSATAVHVDPFRCRVWELHDRLEDYLTEKSCCEEIESFAKHGQIVAALGRRLKQDPGFDVEIICGARRLFAARHLNRPLLVELRELTDLEALIAMDLENRQRKDVSPYERGISYAKWLRKGFFQSQEELARVVQVSASQVSRLLKIARLPAVVLSAFEQPTQVQENWGLELYEAWEDASRRELLTRRARALAGTRAKESPETIFRQLMAPSGAARSRRRARRDSIVRIGSHQVVRIRRLRKYVSILVPCETATDSLIGAVAQSVAAVLEQAESSQPVNGSQQLSTALLARDGAYAPAVNAFGEACICQTAGACDT
jgi:ParB family chromosome partitioning protein